MNATEHHQDGRHDFDFFTGTWKIHNRRLKSATQEWGEFEGVSSAQPILGGLGNFDTVTMYPKIGVLHGMTLRLFNPATQEWSLYWSDSNSAKLFPPMIGKFENGIGHFYAHERIANQHIFSRFIWSDISATNCHWEQALSWDGGASWQTNWTMDMVKEG